MKGNEFGNLSEWFQEYVRSFYTDDDFIQQNIILKEEHSLRVVENAVLIAEAGKLDDEDLFLARTIALFHDIGRFEQIRKYRTFRDSDSENHANLGVRVLKEEKVLSNLPASEQKLILTAIGCHNMHILPDIPDKKTHLHSRIIRDADKLDIYKVFTDHFAIRAESPNSALDQEMPDTHGYSKVIIDDLMNNKIASMQDVRNYNDLNLTRLAWVFDMNTVKAMQLLRERGYIEKIIAVLPQSKEIDELHSHLENYIDNILENKTSGP
ncbi:HD domain-containing protein [Methanolobus sp. WCC4]|uniref:HD domain-containing protein n=1 Tax=Methanolobus sp. WCC4 TaxID=3125784 RepID=UPI0030FA2985